jgi:hypothetical protein
VKQGPGSSTFGPDGAGDTTDNSFDITPFPEESVNDKNDSTYHKNGVLTYFGHEDAAKGFTGGFLEKVLTDGFSRPGPLLAPVPAEFKGRADAYAVDFLKALRDPKSLDDPKNYTFRVGAVEQVAVPGGVVNITTADHQVYRGTIHRVVLNVNGDLFVYTSGSGINKYNNESLADEMKFGVVRLPPVLPNQFRRYISGVSNDIYGAMAFRQLDQQMFKYVESIRKGEIKRP